MTLLLPVILQTARIYSGVPREALGWRSAVGLYCKFNRCAVYIHQSAVRVRLLAELEECYEASQNVAGGSLWRDTLARYMGVPAVTTAEFTQL